MKVEYPLNSKVRISRENDNDGYDEYRNQDLIVTDVATGTDDHPGYDEGVNQPLYDLKTVRGKNVPFSLYEYELEDA